MLFIHHYLSLKAIVNQNNFFAFFYSWNDRLQNSINILIEAFVELELLIILIRRYENLNLSSRL
jgi:hypothetical protein